MRFTELSLGFLVHVYIVLFVRLHLLDQELP